ncbi:MlaD family protein [Marinimicrobium alkaliphilum]|uniref:MlaD family protein n=1 Tax=Marinimicrobium alkaliphilum TaxID=2202654 RepID=UPI000DBA2981|nr:MlaD family protein [Marinimicrobium alkaliphilum]
MEPRAHHVLIGLFTLIAAGAALLFALWLSQSSADREYAYYRISFDQAVTGLAVGNAVLYSGIRVGDVLSLELDRDDHRRVLADIRVFSDTPVREDTRASMELTNITGNMSIQLRGGEPDSPALPGDRENPPVINADASPLSSLMSNGEGLIDNLAQLLENVNRILSEENAESITEILANLKLTSDTLASERGELTRGLNQFSELMEAVGELTVQVSGLIDDQGREALDSINRTAVMLESLIEDNRGGFEQSVRGINDITPAIKELRQTLASLQRLSQRLEESPSDVLFGRDSLKEYSP